MRKLFNAWKLYVRKRHLMRSGKYLPKIVDTKDIWTQSI